MTKTKDCKVNLSDFTSEGFEINANKKTALRIEELTKSDLENNKLSFSITDGNLVVTNTSNDNKLIVKNYKKIKYIKTDVIGKNYNLFNIISNNVVDNLSNVITSYNSKKRTMTGTSYNDIINAKLSDYIVPNTGKNKNKGLTIKGGNGNDIITGTLGNDVITGGSGTTIVNYAKGDGNDVVYLTKGENFSLNFADLTKDDLRFVFVNKDKDLRIYTDKTSNDEYITIKNFVKKDVTNNSNSKKNILDSSSVEIIFNNVESTRIDLRTAVNLYKKEITKNYTGSWLSETISAEDYIVYANKKKTIESDDWTKKGLAIKANGGDDEIIGSNYSDTIYGGSGNDTITGGLGNDKLAGGSGDNTFIFSSEDGIDTVTDAKNGDIIKITDTNSDELRYIKNNSNLEIYYSEDYESDNKIIVQNYFKSNNKIERLIAADKEISLNNIAISGIIGSGTVRGTDGDDIIFTRGKGNVKIYTGKGNDLIKEPDYYTSRTIYFYEGDGQDIIEGDYGERYYKGKSLHDTLIFEEGTNITYTNEWDVSGELTARNLILNYGNSSDKVILLDYSLNFDPREYIKIGNKAVKTLTSYLNLGKNIDVLDNNKTINGTDKEDYIELWAKNCTIFADDGDDYLNIIASGYPSNNSTIYLGGGNDICKAPLHYATTIYDESGNDDKIIFDWAKEATILRFDIAVDEDGNIVESLSKNMYITETSDFGQEKGIKVIDQFVEGNSIEEIKTQDKYVLTTFQINQLRQNVASWLHNNGFESVQQIIDSNNETDIQNLIAEFQKADWQQVN